MGGRDVTGTLQWQPIEKIDQFMADYEAGTDIAAPEPARQAG